MLNTNALSLFESCFLGFCPNDAPSVEEASSSGAVNGTELLRPIKRIAKYVCSLVPKKSAPLK